MKIKTCNCKDFRENIHRINDLILLASIRIIKPIEIKSFEYCPWCGKKLIEKKS
jgi:hypothetical protein